MHIVGVKFFGGSRVYDFLYDLNELPQEGHMVLVWDKGLKAPVPVKVVSVREITDLSENNTSDKVLANINELYTTELERRTGFESLARMTINAIKGMNVGNYNELQEIGTFVQDKLGLH